MKNRGSIFVLLSFLSFVFIYSCDTVVELKDGYTLYGNISDLRGGQRISSVIIYVGYNSVDSVYFSDFTITSDTLGKFVFRGGIATAPNDEILRFEHPDYYRKDIILKNSATGENGKYSLFVTLQPK